MGGLPWGLYLVCARNIREQLFEQLNQGLLKQPVDFDPLIGSAYFDATLLNRIKTKLFDHQELNFEPESAARCIKEFQEERRRLRENGNQLHDAYSWLLVAESIMASSMVRTESRGCFIRDDYPSENEHFKGLFTRAHYDSQTDEVIASTVHRDQVDEIYTAIQ